MKVAFNLASRDLSQVAFRSRLRSFQTNEDLISAKRARRTGSVITSKLDIVDANEPFLSDPFAQVVFVCDD